MKRLLLLILIIPCIALVATSKALAASNKVAASGADRARPDILGATRDSCVRHHTRAPASRGGGVADHRELVAAEHRGHREMERCSPRRDQQVQPTAQRIEAFVHGAINEEGR